MSEIERQADRQKECVRGREREREGVGGAVESILLLRIGYLLLSNVSVCRHTHTHAHTRSSEPCFALASQYKLMCEALVYLAHLDYEDTEHIMLEKLGLQVGKGNRLWLGLA